MKYAKLLSQYKLGSLDLKNRIVISPLRCPRAIGNVPNHLMAEYYRLRADAGLIITEGTSPLPNGFGFNSIPGIYNDKQVQNWKEITDTVHSKDCKIFIVKAKELAK